MNQRTIVAGIVTAIAVVTIASILIILAIFGGSGPGAQSQDRYGFEQQYYHHNNTSQLVYNGRKTIPEDTPIYLKATGPDDEFRNFTAHGERVTKPNIMLTWKGTFEAGLAPWPRPYPINQNESVRIKQLKSNYSVSVYLKREKTVEVIYRENVTNASPAPS